MIANTSDAACCTAKALKRYDIPLKNPLAVLVLQAGVLADGVIVNALYGPFCKICDTGVPNFQIGSNQIALYPLAIVHPLPAEKNLTH